MAYWKIRINNSSTVESDLWRNSGPSTFQLQEIMLKSDKIWCTYLATMWMTLVHVYGTDTLVTALVSRPVIFLQMLAAKAVDAGASSLITVFNPNTNHSHYRKSYNRSEPPAFTGIRDPAFIKCCYIGLFHKNLCSCLLVTATNWFFY